MSHYTISIKNSPHFALLKQGMRWEDTKNALFSQIDTSPLRASPILWHVHLTYWILQEVRAFYRRLHRHLHKWPLGAPSNSRFAAGWIDMANVQGGAPRIKCIVGNWKLQWKGKCIFQPSGPEVLSTPNNFSLGQVGVNFPGAHGSIGCTLHVQRAQLKTVLRGKAWGYRFLSVEMQALFFSSGTRLMAYTCQLLNHPPSSLCRIWDHSKNRRLSCLSCVLSIRRYWIQAIHIATQDGERVVFTFPVS